MAASLNTKTKKWYHISEGGRAHKEQDKTKLFSAAILKDARS